MGLFQKACKIGKLKLLDTKIGTSARRFKEGGQLKTLLLMHKIKLLYVLGYLLPSLIKCTGRPDDERTNTYDENPNTRADQNETYECADRGEECAQLHRCFLMDLFNVFEYLRGEVDIFLAYTPAGALHLIEDMLPDYIKAFPQEGEDLGERMANAIEHVLNEGL